MLYGDVLNYPDKSDVPESGVGPSKWVRCRKHAGVEYLLIWVQSIHTWLGDCPACKPDVHVPVEAREQKTL
jgi:hypothetical protein